MNYALKYIVIYLIGFQGILGATNETEVLLSSYSVPFELVDGLILVPITVNLEERTFILDSGTPSIIINSQDIRGDVQYQTIDQEIPAEVITLNQVSLGPLEESNLPALEMDLGFVEDKLNRKIDGIVGSNFIRNFDVLLDYKKLRLIFLGENEDYNEIISRNSFVTQLNILNANGDLPTVEVLIDGKLKNMALDTGAPHNVIHIDNSNGKLSHKTISINEVNIQSAQFKSQDLGIFNQLSTNEIDGILSTFSLNADQIIVSLKRGKLYLIYDNSSVHSSRQELAQLN